MAAGDGCEGCLEVGEGLDAVDFAGLDQRGDAPPSNSTFVVTGEECILAIEGDRADQVFDPVGVDLDATVGQEGLQAFPMVMDVGQLLAQPGFGGDFPALCLKPLTEGCHQRHGAGLTGGQALAGRDASNVGLDGIYFGDLTQALGGSLRAVCRVALKCGI